MNNVNIKMGKMRELAKYAYNHTKYYKRLYKNIEIDLVELPYGLPIAQSQDLLEQSLDFRADIPIQKIVASSGTSGNPKLIFRTFTDLERSISNQFQLMQWCNINKNDIVGIVQPSGIWGYADLTAEASKQIGAAYINLGAIDNETCIKMIYDLQITVLDIAPSRLWEILNQIKTHRNYRLKVFPIRIIMSAGEKLSSDFAGEIYKMYPNVLIYDHYGSEELDGLGGTDCNVRDEWNFKLFENDFIFEVLDENYVPVQEGTIGRLIVTSLYHRGTPLIRYNLDDLVILKNNRLQVLGRGKDWINLFDSVKIHSFQVQKCVALCLDSTTIWQLQICEMPPKAVLLQLIIANNNVNEEKMNELYEKMSKLTIDVYAQFQIDKIKIKVVCDMAKLIYSGRGKLNRMLDTRKI